MNIINNTQHQQYQAELNGEKAYIEYRWYKGDLAFMHTSVPEQFEGLGIASAMARFALNDARKQGVKIMLYCPFMAGFVKKHPEYQDLVDKKYQQ